MSHRGARSTKGNRLKVGMVQMSMVEDLDTNIRRGVEGVKEAAEKGADIVCLPELFAWRYFAAEKRSKEEPQPIPGPASRALSDAARKNSIVLVGGSIYESAGKKQYNTCVVFEKNGESLTKYRKVHIPEDEHYYEQDYFSGGSSYPVARTSVARVGTLICFDQWYPEPARIARLKGAEVLFYPTAIGWVKGIEEVEGDWKKAWEAVQVGHAVANSVIVCAVNRVGVEGATRFWGGSFVCDQFGKVLMRAGEEEGVFVAECDMKLGKLVEDGWGFMRNRKSRTYSKVVS